MHKRIIQILALVGTAALMCNENFVIKKQPQKASKNTLKATCGNALRDSLALTPDILKNIADIQAYGIEIVELMMDDVFFQGASLEELKKEALRYEQLSTDLENILQQLEEHKQLLAKHQKKYSPALRTH